MIRSGTTVRGSDPRGDQTMTIRTQLKAGGISINHNEALQVRSAIKAGGRDINHNEALQVRTWLKAGSMPHNHNEALQVGTSLKARRGLSQSQRGAEARRGPPGRLHAPRTPDDHPQGRPARVARRPRRTACRTRPRPFQPLASRIWQHPPGFHSSVPPSVPQGRRRFCLPFHLAHSATSLTERIVLSPIR